MHFSPINMVSELNSWLEGLGARTNSSSDTEEKVFRAILPKLLALSTISPDINSRLNTYDQLCQRAAITLLCCSAWNKVMKSSTNQISSEQIREEFIKEFCFISEQIKMIRAQFICTSFDLQQSHSFYSKFKQQ